MLIHITVTRGGGEVRAEETAEQVAAVLDCDFNIFIQETA